MNGMISPDAHFAMMQASQSSSSLIDAGRAVDAAKKSRDARKLDEAARDFEALFMAEMMKPMFEGISTEAPFGGGKTEDVFRGFLLREYGQLISQTGSIGLADFVRTAMVEMQEKANGGSADGLPATE